MSRVEGSMRWRTRSMRRVEGSRPERIRSMSRVEGSRPERMLSMSRVEGSRPERMLSMSRVEGSMRRRILSMPGVERVCAGGCIRCLGSKIFENPSTGCVLTRLGAFCGLVPGGGVWRVQEVPIGGLDTA